MPDRESGYITRWLEKSLHRMDNPSQFLGTEPGASRKPWNETSVRWLIAASWPYFQGTGSQGIPAVCSTINRNPGFYADRFYLPETPRDLRSLERSGIPVFGIESRHQALDFDVIGTSISYAVLWLNFCKMLMLSSIPLRWRDREADPGAYPMLVAGGQACRGPGFMEPVADCIFLGEAEDEPGNGGLSQVCARIAQFKQEGTWRSDRIGCYERLASEFNYLFFPRFVQTFYRYEDRGLSELSKQVSGYESLLPGMRMPFRSRTVKNLDNVAPLTEAPLLYADPRMGAGDLEVGRGCDAWCSFCSLGWNANPPRERSVAKSVEHAKIWQRNMGSTELSPFSPDFPMHRQKKRLLADLLENVNSSMDVTAMRIDDFIADDQYVLIQARAGADGVTLGLEGNCLHHSTRIQVPGVGLLSLWDIASDQRHLKTVKVGRDDAELNGVSYSGDRQVWRVTLSDGSQIMATPEHLVKTLDGTPAAGRIYLTPEERRRYGTSSNYLSKRLQADELGEVWREVRDLRPGMVLRSYYGQMRWPSEQSGHMGEDMAWLLGLLSGDGRVTPAGIEVRCDDPGVQERVTDTLGRFGVQARVHREEGRCPIVTGYRRELASVLAGFGVLDTDTKRHVPYYVWRSPRSVVAAYLRGVLDADGCVPERSRQHGLTVVHGTNSEEFARDLGLLISAFGHPVSLQRNVSADGYVMWHTTIHSVPDADWSWLQFSETSRQQAMEAAFRRTGARIGQVQWRGGRDGIKYVTVKKVELDVEVARVYDLHVPDVVSFTANNVVVHNSQRMRDLVGKGTSDDDVAEAVTRGIRAGFRKFKLFMITNLPGEELGDVMKIVELGRRLAAIRDEMSQPNVLFQFSWTPLLIESQTPFQWFAPTPPDHALIKVAEEFRDLGIQFKVGAKSLVYGTPVLTPGGFTAIESLRVGDPVIDPDGYHSTVLNAWDNLTEPVYLLTFSDGSEVEAGAGHLWDVFRWHGTGRDASGKQGAEVRQHLVTTEQLRELVGKSPMAPWLPDSPGLAHADLGDGVQCTVDPYLLGVILGDGSLGRTIKITSADKEIVDLVAEVLPLGVSLVPGKPKSKATDYCLSVDGGGSTLNPLGEQLRTLGLCCQRSWEKFVPVPYKMAPAVVRLAVLQGLMDTDGCRPASGRAAKFTSASRLLRDDVLWLARSLGLCASVKDRQQASFTLKSGERRLGRPVYVCYIWETPEVRVFRLSRKLLPLGRRKSRVLRSVEYMRDEATRCIEVSAPSARFVVGDGQFIPTHNAETNKVTLFQLCQRASREVGEVITDVIEELDTACWGGVPRDTRDRLEAAMRRHGFRNGLADAFDERFAGDLFGWEYVDMGVSRQRMWDTYRQMVEFLEGTDAETYEDQFSGPPGGNEWVARCDQQCGGASCGVCDGEDLKLRAGRVKAQDADIDLARIKVIDQESVAFRIRARIVVPPENRFVTREHWRYAIRRAAYRAAHDMDWKTGIAKKTIQLASDACKHRDWACGTDYAEFALTWHPPGSELQVFMQNMTTELAPWLQMGDWRRYPAAASVRRDADLVLWELETPAGPDEMTARLRDFGAAEYVKLVFRSDSAYFGSGIEEVNAKDYVSDLWLVRYGHTHKLRMLISAKVGPYALYAALMGKPSWIEAAAKPAVRIGVFAASAKYGDLLRVPCDGCPAMLPEDLLSKPYAQDFCPRCTDEVAGTVTAVLSPRSLV